MISFINTVNRKFIHRSVNKQVGVVAAAPSPTKVLGNPKTSTCRIDRARKRHTRKRFQQPTLQVGGQSVRAGSLIGLASPRHFTVTSLLPSSDGCSGPRFAQVDPERCVAPRQLLAGRTYLTSVS